MEWSFPPQNVFCVSVCGKLGCFFCLLGLGLWHCERKTKSKTLEWLQLIQVSFYMLVTSTVLVLHIVIIFSQVLCTLFWMIFSLWVVLQYYVLQMTNSPMEKIIYMQATELWYQRYFAITDKPLMLTFMAYARHGDGKFQLYLNNE